MSTRCTYRFTGPAGKPMVITGLPAVKAYLVANPDMVIAARPAGAAPARFSLGDVRQQLLATKVGSYRVADLFETSKKFNWWHKTVGTQYQKAVENGYFRRVFDAASDHQADISRFANTAADQAPDLLPRLEKLSDMKKAGLSAADNKAISKPIFEGTLLYMRDGNDRVVPAPDVASAGLVWTDDELRSRYQLDDAQIGLYRQFRRAVDQSLDDLARAQMLRYATEEVGPIRHVIENAPTTDRAGAILIAHLKSMAASDPGKRRLHLKTADALEKKLEQLGRLKDKGYAPLMRFGRYAVDVTEGTGKDQKRLFFGLYETERDARRAARELAAAHPNANVEASLLSEDAYKLFSGVSLETVESMATLMENQGQEADEFIQEYLKEARANHDAMKRMIHRKGVEGYSEDVSRVLASFLTSNARAASTTLHFGEMVEAAREIPQNEGDVKDEAVKLVKYLQEPSEEGARVRGLLFVNYLGGSVASAMVNMTQPLTMTYPFLSQFAGPARAASALMGAMKDAVHRGAIAADSELGTALKRAESEGVVSPQEIHQLQAEAMRRYTTGSGKPALYLRNTLFAWGSLFSAAEQFNRRATFIAAYRVAEQKGMPDPFAFAERAVVETQGIYAKHNRPNWARGTVGATVMTFKQYSISYLEFLKRLPPRERALALAVLFVAAGAQGMPFADDLEDIIDTIGQLAGYGTNSRKALRDLAIDTLGRDAGEFVLRGFSTLPGVPIDVAARMGLSNLIPGTGLALKSTPDKTSEVLEVLGPAGGFARDVGKAVQNLDPTMALPVAIRNAIKGYQMMSSGMYRDEGGRKVMDTDAVDAAMKFIGFQPAAVGAESARVRLLAQDVRLNKVVEGEIASQWAAGVFEGDQAKVDAARKRLSEWNRDNPDSPIGISSRQVRQRVQQMQATRAERFVKSAPKEMRQRIAREVMAEDDE